MKTRNLSRFKNLAVAVGIVLGRGAHAETVLTFDVRPGGQVNNAAVLAGFGSNASASSPGVTVTGNGTPNIVLTWGVTSIPGGGGGGGNNIEWDYYVDGVWTGLQLNNSAVNNQFGTNTLPHSLTFTPVNASAVVINAFNFHGYYSGEHYEYDWSVTAGANTLTNGSYIFDADGTKNFPVSIGCTGAPNQALTLNILRTGGGGSAFNIAVDDISFKQVGGTTNGLQITSVSPANGATGVSPLPAYLATIQDGTNLVATGSVQLKLNGSAVTPAVSKAGLVTTVSFNSTQLLAGGSTNTWRLTFSDGGAPAKNFTNDVTFIVSTFDKYEWRFTHGDLSPDLGDGVLSYSDSETETSLTTFGITDGTTVPHLPDGAARYLHFPQFLNQGNGYNVELTHTLPNGGGANVNNYTLIFDLLLPAPADWAALANTDPDNNTDADFYIDPNGNVGLINYSTSNPIQPGNWYRLAVSLTPGSGGMNWYVNGTNVLTRDGTSVDGSFSIYSSTNAGPDLRLFNENYDGVTKYTHEFYVAGFAFTDRTMSAAEIAALGGPKSSGIFLLPRLSIAPSGNNVVVSWATNFTSFGLQAATNLTTAPWQPVAGVVNNSVTVPASGRQRYFRLSQP